MSVKYSIVISLHAKYNHENIKSILKKGTDKGLIYYDHILGERYENGPVLNAEQAASKIIHAIEEGIEGGPCVFARIEETFCFLFFFKSESNHIRFDFGEFGSPIRKDFKENFYYIDFDHYTRIALDLCKDFAIIKLETDSF